MQSFKPHRHHAGKIQLFPALMLALLAASAGIWVALNSSSDTTDDLEGLQQQLRNSLVFPDDFKSVPTFSLLNQHGDTVSDELLKGQWNLIFFGFTHCPDVCPLTLSTVRQAVDEIREDAGIPDPQVVFVSVDPKRDTPEKLSQYVAFFDPTYIGLTGELNNIYELTRPMNIVVQFTADEENPESYTVDHTASIFLVDPELRVRGSFKVPHEADVIFDDYKTLVAGLNEIK